MRRFAIVLALACLLGVPAAVAADDAEVDDFIELLKSDLAAESREIVAEVMQFTDLEADLFWPIYDEYLKKLEPIADRRIAIIRELAESWPQIPDRRASKLAEDFFEVQEDVLALQRKTYDKIRKTLNATTGAKWLQVDNRIRMLINLQVAAELPIIP